MRLRTLAWVRFFAQEIRDLPKPRAAPGGGQNRLRSRLQPEKVPSRARKPGISGAQRLIRPVAEATCPCVAGFLPVFYRDRQFACHSPSRTASCTAVQCILLVPVTLIIFEV